MLARLGWNCIFPLPPRGGQGQQKERTVSLAIAVDRLYTTGWLPDGDEPYAAADLDRLPGGLRFPTVPAVVRAFADAGLELTVRQNLMFNCSRATWRPVDGGPDGHGAVVGSCDREAAVYALAQLRLADRNRAVPTLGVGL